MYIKITSSYPPSSEHGKPGHIERVLDLFFGVISGAVGGLSSPQQKKVRERIFWISQYAFLVDTSDSFCVA